MVDYNDTPKTGLKWLGFVFGSVVLTSSAIAWGGGPPTRPGKPVIIEEPAGRPTEAERTGPTPTAPAGTLQPTQPTEDTIPRFPLPSARISPVNGRVTLKLINSSNVVIEYQVSGGTRPRLVGQQSESTLEQLTIPINLTYQREDGGLLFVRPVVTGPGVLEIRFEATGNINLDTRSLSINEQGIVFLN